MFAHFTWKKFLTLLATLAAATGTALNAIPGGQVVGIIVTAIGTIATALQPPNSANFTRNT